MKYHLLRMIGTSDEEVVPGNESDHPQQEGGAEVHDFRSFWGRNDDSKVSPEVA